MRQNFYSFGIAILLLIHNSCKKIIGYFEIRKQTEENLEIVNWGGLINFGTIASNQEKGEETELSGSGYFYLCP